MDRDVYKRSARNEMRCGLETQKKTKRETIGPPKQQKMGCKGTIWKKASFLY